eukprot:CAMPEP_0182924552 /NCGR_PEP_ID=MMETSP0105_2-20130417/6598_1 /TAXON_ID=81532 ORGANISM="Acanthoeca-like sp., Strain 10tr" /NCGR_SAMPLE_ID=MMETSP0105_2 /ASSEMBLY_ACC=CAM_ASM_000205 /LENGTH=555 /DNA_ID=CAMNT_0025062343 /DNA_START=63 /DNA_END=1730 /DNA_ORIENTATION=-
MAAAHETLREEATASVLTTSAGTQFAETTSPMMMREYSGMLATILGLSSPTAYNWNGLLPAGLFNRPRTVASIVVEGPTVDFTSDAVASFPLTFGPAETNTNDALRTLMGGQVEDPTAAVPSLLAEVFGTRATIVSVSADGEAAKLSGLHFGSATMHTVSKTAAGYVDNAANTDAFTIPAEIDWSLFDGVTVVDATTVKVGAVSFSGTDLELFGELAAMLEVARGLKNHADSHPSVLTFTVTTFAQLAAREGASSPVTKAAKQVVATAARALAKSLAVAYGEKAVVVGVSLGATVTRDAPDAVTVMRLRRDSVDVQLDPENVSNSTLAESVPLAAYAEYPEHFTVDSCARYKCSCFAVYTAYQALESYKATCGTRCYNFSSYNNASFNAEASQNTAAGCIEITGGEADKPGQLCAWDQAACDCSNEAFFEEVNGLSGINFLYPGKKLRLINATLVNGTEPITAKTSLRYAVGRAPNRRMSTDPICTRCAYGFQLSNGLCYEAGTQTAAGQAAFWIWLTGIAALVGVWYVLHQISDGGKWAYLGDVPDVPDAKKTM